MTKKTVEQLNVVTVKTLLDHLAINAQLGQTTFIIGPPGVGKTDLVAQAAKTAGYASVQFAASEMMPEDLGGIVAPDMTARIATRLMPDIIATINATRESSGKNVLVFFDELTNAAMSVMASCFKLLHEGCAGGFKVPAGTVFVAAGNSPEVSSAAQELPAPLINRLSMLDFAGPTFEEWEAYALGVGVHPVVLGFVKQYPQYLTDVADFNCGSPTPTPRSWMATSRFLTLVQTTGNTGLRMSGIASRVGSKAALAMEAHLKYGDQLLPFSEIVKDPETARVHAQFAVAYMQIVSVLAQLKTEKDVYAAMTYARRAGHEMFPLFVRGIVEQGDQIFDWASKYLTAPDRRLVAARVALGANARTFS